MAKRNLLFLGVRQCDVISHGETYEVYIPALDDPESRFTQYAYKPKGDVLFTSEQSADAYANRVNMRGAIDLRHWESINQEYVYA